MKQFVGNHKILEARRLVGKIGGQSNNPCR